MEETDTKLDKVVLLFWILAEEACLLFCLLQTLLLVDQHFQSLSSCGPLTFLTLFCLSWYFGCLSISP